MTKQNQILESLRTNFYDNSISEGKIPMKGKASGYIGTLTLKPTASCKGIPSSLLNNIRKILSPKVDWKSEWEGFEIKGGKLTAILPVDSIIIEYLADVHSDKEKREFIEELKKAGWVVEE